MRTIYATMAVVLGLLAGGCGGEAEQVTPENVSEAITAEVREQTGAEPASSGEPCEILTEELIRSHFEVAAETEISRQPSKYSPHPLCTVSWAKPNAAELQKERQAAMSEYVMKKARGEDAKMPSFRTDDEVTLTLYEPVFDSPGDAMNAFESLTRRLSQGVTASHENVEMTVQADLIDVEGVGDDAKWASKLRQISVVDGRRIYHVGVNTGADLEQEREKATAIAKAVGETL